MANIRLSSVSKGCITWQKGHFSFGTKAGNPLSQVANQNAGFVYLPFSAAQNDSGKPIYFFQIIILSDSLQAAL